MGDPFVWHDVYADPGSIDNSLRQWRALSLAAPSLGLQVTGDATVDRYPFSVKPDEPLTVQRLLAVIRDGYEGTESGRVGSGLAPLSGYVRWHSDSLVR
jgi:dipeptidase